MPTQNKKPSGTFIKHIACTSPSCISSDGMAVYEQPDGSHDATCFVCNHYDPNPLGGEEAVADTAQEEVLERARLSLEDIQNLPIQAIKDRKISAKVTNKYGVRVSFDQVSGEVNAHYYPMYKKGRLTGYKKRGLPKHFSSIGDVKDCELFGAQVAGANGQMLIITEGELDALAATQMFYQKGKNYRVVSLPHGANIRSIKDNLEWIESYKTIVLCFDQDEAGQAAVEASAELLTPGKVKIMRFSEKDPCDMLKADKGNEFYSSLVNAVDHKPDGIVSMSDIREKARQPVQWGLAWPWESLTNKTYGRRRKELYGFGAGSGCGKTEGFKEIIQHVIENDNLPVGVFFLEEPPETTAKVLAGKFFNKRFHVPDGDWTQEELDKGLDALDGKIYFYNHFGQKSYESLKAKIRYMVISLGIKDIFIDHLTALVTEELDVNAALGRIMADMASLTQELDFTLYFISHLSTPNGTPHEEGGRVTASQFRGSRTIMFWSHFLFGYERNQQAESEAERNTTTFRVLKDRYTGLSTGHTFKLFYDHNTGRMKEVEYDELEFEG